MISTSPAPALDAARHRFAIAVVGGSSAVLDYGQTRFVSDPVFSPPGRQGALTKLTGPAVEPADLGDVDAVLLSHDDHYDNFDLAARAWVSAAGMTVFTGPAAADRLGRRAVPLVDGEHATLPRRDGEGAISVHAVEAVHGPLDGDADPSTGRSTRRRRGSC